MPADAPETSTERTPEIEAEVSAAEAGLRIDRFLARNTPGLSRSRIQRLIREGYVRLAGQPGEERNEKRGEQARQSLDGGEEVTDPAYLVRQGQRFRLHLPEPRQAALVPQPMPLDILHEDDALLVLEKPPGLAVHPGAGRADGTLVNALLAHCGDSLSGIGGIRRPGIVHRLDIDTSGLMIVAKTDKAHAGLVRQFEARTVDRVYLALVWGLPVPAAGTIEGNIGRSPRNRKKMAVLSAPKGRPALTRYQMLASRQGQTSLLACRLASGRTHQIRVHLAHRRHPVVGDPLYGRNRKAALESFPKAARDAVAALGRQALHAGRLAFRHPVSGENLSFTSAPPGDFRATIDALGFADAAVDFYENPLNKQ